jgi:hypothetical protein
VLIARSLTSARHRGVAARGCGPVDRHHRTRLEMSKKRAGNDSDRPSLVR